MLRGRHPKCEDHRSVPSSRGLIAEGGVTVFVHFGGSANRPIVDLAKVLPPRVVFSMFGIDDETTDQLRQLGIDVVSLTAGSL